jgi:hypothetical protein
MGVLLIVFGVLGIAGGILGTGFYKADVIALGAFKEKSSTWSGRLVFIAVGAALIAVGIKLLWDVAR